MKFKYYLRGLGIGIIFATIILTVSYHKNHKGDMSDSDIISAAKKLGMDFVESTEGLETTEGAIPTEGTETTESPQETESTEQKKSQKKNQSTESTEETQTSEQAEVKNVSVTVTDDISWRMVFNQLADAGIVKDGNELYEYYNEKYSDVYLQNGTFKIPSGATYDEIIKILSTKP